MQIANQLKAVSLGAFPCAVRWDAVKNKWQKRPLTVDKEPWSDTARRPINDPAVRWAGCTAVGVPVPEGVVVIDLDTYKPGCTTVMAEQVLGASMPWAEAHIQNTIGGGQHYAFRAPTWAVRQTNDIGGPGSGIDTRVGGKGFVCTGEGYQPAGSFGVFRMAYPDSLPVLPDACRPLLEHVHTEAPMAPPPGAEERSPAEVLDALAYLDPTAREEWFAVGCALKHYFHDDEHAGYEIWDRWSAGEFWQGGCPAGYVPDTQPDQWASIKLQRGEGTINSGTLFFKAMRAGWRPPAQMDVSAAFGQGAADADTFGALVQRILEHGTDSTKVEGLLAEITASKCNELQRLLLRNELKAALKEARLLDKDMGRVIDKATGSGTSPAAVGLYGANDTENAELFLQTRYPDDTLITAEEEIYRYNGRCWERIGVDILNHEVATAMRASRPQNSRIESCVRAVRKYAPAMTAAPGGSLKGRIIYENGVLDLDTGVMGVHGKQNYCTVALPFAYDPAAGCPQWHEFLADTFDGDQERIHLLQEWFGYLLSGDRKQQKILFLIGAKRAGKGTVGTVIAHLVGADNFAAGSLSAFATDDFLDGLRTKTVMFAGDAAKRLSANKVNEVIERLKSISGNDAVGFGRKWKSYLTASLPTRIVIAANNVPALFDDSGALASRLSVIPFDKSNYGCEDKTLIDRLVQEMPGIANWALAGLQRLEQRGEFTRSQAAQQEEQYIRETYSPIDRFVEEACVLDPDSRVESGELHGVYRAWCLANDDDILKRKTFVSALKDALRGKGVWYGAVWIDGETKRGFKGVAPRPGADSVAQAFKPEIVK